MARNDTTNGPGGFTSTTRTTAEKAPKNPPQQLCTNCNGTLEVVGNRLFMMYKRARLPQPKNDALVCAHCGWVEGDPQFQALLEERINHR